MDPPPPTSLLSASAARKQWFATHGTQSIGGAVKMELDDDADQTPSIAAAAMQQHARPLAGWKRGQAEGSKDDAMDEEEMENKDKDNLHNDRAKKHQRLEQHDGAGEHTQQLESLTASEQRVRLMAQMRQVECSLYDADASVQALFPGLEELELFAAIFDAYELREAGQQAGQPVMMNLFEDHGHRIPAFGRHPEVNQRGTRSTDANLRLSITQRGLCWGGGSELWSIELIPGMYPVQFSQGALSCGGRLTAFYAEFQKDVNKKNKRLQLSAERQVPVRRLHPRMPLGVAKWLVWFNNNFTDVATTSFREVLDAMIEVSWIGLVGVG